MNSNVATFLLQSGSHLGAPATFGPDGPAKCSGLDVERYDAVSLHHELGTKFQLVRDALVPHKTPFGTTQQFLYCQFSLNDASKEDL